MGRSTAATFTLPPDLLHVREREKGGGFGETRDTGEFRYQKSTAARIVEVKRELAALEQRQRDELITTIAIVVGSGVCFSARELYRHGYVSAELQTAFDEAGITSARQLGKRLRQLSIDKSRFNNTGLERVGADHDGALWVCRL